VKRPEDCESIWDVRQAIDALDQEIIRLLGRRSSYVEAAARFKTGEQSVRAPERGVRCSKHGAAGPKRTVSTPA
jgi:isochorismate pyruvate lyase